MRQKYLSNFGPLFVAILITAGCNSGGSSSTAGSGSGQGSDVPQGERAPNTVVQRASCQPGDLPDTALQGQVPIEDRLSGRAAQGYNCNLTLVNEPTGRAFASFDSYKNCLYMPSQTWVDSGGHLGAVGVGTGKGIQVFDMTDTANPKLTTYLTSPIALAPDESLAVNQRRGLMVMNSTFDSQIDIYDLEPDCTQPRLIGTFDMSPATGHAGWFSPDGMTYWMTSLVVPRQDQKYVFPIDLTDAANPKLMAQFEVEGAQGSHNGWTSDDSRTAYACQAGADAETNGILVFDAPVPGQDGVSPLTHEQSLINRIPLEGAVCQDAKAVSYNGVPYLIANSEYTVGRSQQKGPSSCPDNLTNFGVPQVFDISNIMEPKTVAHLMLEVDDPENCEATAFDQDFTSEAQFPGEVYDTHFCRPDRLKDPTILACVRFLGGLEVYDIRDPYNPKELAYYRPGTLGEKADTLATLLEGSVALPTTMENCFAPPIVVASKGEVWFGCYFSGLHVAKFAESVYPFPESLTCNDDYYFDQYNPGFCSENNLPKIQPSE